MKSLVIFDLDGTLINSIDDLGHAANHALEHYGYPTHDLSAYHFFAGNGVTRLIERALPLEDRSQSNIDRLRLKFTEYYEAHLTDFTRPYDGITALLETLARMNINVAVASNKYQAAVDKIIPTLFPDTKFAAVEGHREGVPSKPDPSIVFNILSQCPTPKDDVLYVGDSGIDMETAFRAGVFSVGVTWGFRPRHELEKNACAIISKPVDLLDLLSDRALLESRFVIR